MSKTLQFFFQHENGELRTVEIAVPDFMQKELPTLKYAIGIELMAYVDFGWKLKHSRIIETADTDTEAKGTSMNSKTAKELADEIEAEFLKRGLPIAMTRETIKEVLIRNGVGASPPPKSRGEMAAEKAIHGNESHVSFWRYDGGKHVAYRMEEQSAEILRDWVSDWIDAECEKAVREEREAIVEMLTKYYGVGGAVAGAVMSLKSFLSARSK